MTTPDMPGRPDQPAPQNPPFQYGQNQHPGRHGQPGLFQQAGPAPKPRRKPIPKTVQFGVAGLILGVLLGVIGTTSVSAAVNDANARAAAEAEANKPRPLPEAVAKCNLTPEETSAKIGDEGHSLSLDSRGEDDYSGLTLSEVNCVLDALNMPDSIRDQMDNTRALDGTQRDTWDNFSVSWNYHPDSGVNVNVKENDG
jgi:hypothetical protein